MPSSAPPHLIELKLRDVHQLFNSMDPSPFHDKDLDADAEEFIVNWSREYPLDEEVRLRVHLEQWPPEDPARLIRDAVHNYFAYRAKLAGLEFRRLLREGRLSLVIGLLFLAACLIARELLTRSQVPFIGYLRESLTIAGWVAMWRPMNIYLYDWWPLRRTVRNSLRLSVMPVEVVGPEGRPGQALAS
ncbi:MAG TPA: hypothetical protein VHE78_19070 [Gemmatimonadaceae bacterium]|nr:hypothetical protein [Gemmatimonadaceae bacterium]